MGGNNECSTSVDSSRDPTSLASPMGRAMGRETVYHELVCHFYYIVWSTENVFILVVFNTPIVFNML